MKVLIIGAGRVGTSMGFLLHKKGFNIIGVHNKNYDSAKKSVAFIGSGLPLRKKELRDKLNEADLIMITTPDDVIAEMADFIASFKLKDPVFLMHMSGLHISDILNETGQDNIYTFSMHPLQSIASFTEGIKLLPESFFTVEGDRKGKEMAVDLANKMDINYGFIEKKYKPLYHVAAVIASNYLVTLINSSYELLQRVDLNNNNVKKGILKLVQGTLDNTGELGPRSALTGPIARGDIETVKKHLQALGEFKPEYLELYRKMGWYTAGLAGEKEIKDFFQEF